MLTKRFDEALVYASETHRSQLRKGAQTPYIAHLLAVSSLTIGHGGDEDQAIAALLHDAAEDQGGEVRLQDIKDRFGVRVGRIVADCTDTMTTPKPSWRTRKENYLLALSTRSDDSLLVSLADKTHNAEAIFHDFRTIGLPIFDRFTGGTAGTLWYYQSLSSAFSALLPGQLAVRLASAVDALNREVSA
ncbi:MAG: HD domain-containing protein [Parvularculaceae bacterium]|nr:HD domain-containing protein [Parvularculaceae bacterium]